jgi:hypothetical protein
MYSKLAADIRKALLAEARRLTREERLQAFARHSKLVTQLYYAGRQARSKSHSGAVPSRSRGPNPSALKPG